MAYLCEFDYGEGIGADRLVVEWLNKDGTTKCEIVYVPERTCWNNAGDGLEQFICSDCEFADLYIYDYNYCPNCGAKVIENG